MTELGGALERAIMEELWTASGPLRVRELMNLLNDGAAKPLAYNTVQTVAERLTRKRLLRRIPDGNAFRYTPTRTRDEHTVALMIDALSGAPDQAAILARFADSMDPADARRMLDVLRKRTGDQREEG